MNPRAGDWGVFQRGVLVAAYPDQGHAVLARNDLADRDGVPATRFTVRVVTAGDVCDWCLDRIADGLVAVAA